MTHNRSPFTLWQGILLILFALSLWTWIRSASMRDQKQSASMRDQKQSASPAPAIRVDQGSHAMETPSSRSQVSKADVGSAMSVSLQPKHVRAPSEPKPEDSPTDPYANSPKSGAEIAEDQEKDQENLNAITQSSDPDINPAAFVDKRTGFRPGADPRVWDPANPQLQEMYRLQGDHPPGAPTAP